MRGKAQPVAHPTKTRLQNSGNTVSKFIKIFITRRGVIGGVNVCIPNCNKDVQPIHIAILTSVVECQRTEYRWDMQIFADSRQKSVTTATSLERSRKKAE